MPATAVPHVAGAAGNRRVMRGGSFNNNERNARCAYRNHNHPNNDWNNNGFRVGVVAAAHCSPGEYPARNAARHTHAWRPRVESKRGLSLAAVVLWATTRACPYARLGRIQNSPGSWVRPWAGALLWARGYHSAAPAGSPDPAAGRLNLTLKARNPQREADFGSFGPGLGSPGRAG